MHNFAAGHGDVQLSLASGSLLCVASDGSRARVSLPFDERYDGAADVAAFRAAARPPRRWGVLLVRKGGFAVALLEETSLRGSKVGRRHVQGRTKAGGQSQQRFARRRDNQARHAYEAAAEEAARILLPGDEALTALVCGGDRHAVDAVLDDPRLTALSQVRVERWLAVPDPRRSVLEGAVADAQALQIRVEQEE